MRGEIALRLPSAAQHAIDAGRDLVSVVSDFSEAIDDGRGYSAIGSWGANVRWTQALLEEPVRRDHAQNSGAADASIDSKVDRNAGVEGP